MKSSAALLFACALLTGCGDSQLDRSGLPGTIWFVEGHHLVRLAGGVRTEVAEDVFPSSVALPDGRLVAIASRGDGSPDSEQAVLVSASGKLDRIGPTGPQVRDPAVDPRGRFIVVAANLDGHSDLYRIELDAPRWSEPANAGERDRTTRLTNESTGNFHPVMIEGELGYVSSRDGNSEIYLGDQRLTTMERDDWEPLPAPGGKVIAFLSDREGPVRIFLMDRDGHAQRRLTGRLVSRAADEDQPTWSRDGKQLAYVLDGHVIVHDLESGSERDVTPQSATDLEPSFSPDGKWLALARGRDLYALPLAGGEPIKLATNARLPRWF